MKYTEGPTIVTLNRLDTALVIRESGVPEFFMPKYNDEEYVDEGVALLAAIVARLDEPGWAEEMLDWLHNRMDKVVGPDERPIN